MKQERFFVIAKILFVGELGRKEHYNDKISKMKLF